MKHFHTRKKNLKNMSNKGEEFIKLLYKYIITFLKKSQKYNK